MTVRGDDVVAQARQWIGTPFHHQGRLRGVGADCAGLLIGVASELGIALQDVAGYSRNPDGVTLQAECDKQLTRIELRYAAPGDVLLLRMGRDPQHLGIISKVEHGEVTAMIHSYAGAPRLCVEHSLDASWRKRIIQAYRLPGVEPCQP